MLDGVVVSANRSVTTRQMAPTIVNVMTPLQFDNLNASTVSSVIAFQPGVRVENSCQNCGFQQVRINYTQILIDSRPVFSALSNVYGIEQLPVSMVDRVEVMRGGGSALFGSSAIAGTINIITKEPLYNSAQLSHTYTNIGGTSAGENNTSLNASLIYGAAHDQRADPGNPLVSQDRTSFQAHGGIPPPEREKARRQQPGSAPARGRHRRAGTAQHQHRRTQVRLFLP